MRILVISNLYPPHVIGGYELGCRDVVDALRRRGHDVRVLTSTYGLAAPEVEDHVHRELSLDWRWPRASVARRAQRTVHREWSSLRAFRSLLREWAPEAIYVWNPTGIPMGVVAAAEASGVPVHYLVSDRWLADWSPRQDTWFRLCSAASGSGSARLMQAACRSIGALLRLPRRGDTIARRRVQFTSRFLAEQARALGHAADGAEVIHWGVDTGRFSPPVTRTGLPIRLLYVGQVVPHKGVHTAVEAMRLLREAHGADGVTLDIVGGTTTGEYEQELRARAEREALGGVVRFCGSVSRDALPAVYRAHDVLLFPSAWDEPFSITLLEGMASGLAVVATATGGTPEILEHETNALLFAAEDASECAARLHRLLADPTLRSRLGAEARRTVERGFGFDMMIDRIERSLCR